MSCSNPNILVLLGSRGLATGEGAANLEFGYIWAEGITDFTVNPQLVTTATTTVIDLAGAPLTPGAEVGKYAAFIGGANNGQDRLITANTATQITVLPALPFAPALFDALAITSFPYGGQLSAAAGPEYTDASKAGLWTANQLVNWSVYPLAGAALGQNRRIIANTVGGMFTTNAVFAPDMVALDSYGLFPPTVRSWYVPLEGNDAIRVVCTVGGASAEAHVAVTDIANLYSDGAQPMAAATVIANWVTFTSGWQVVGTVTGLKGKYALVTITTDMRNATNSIAKFGANTYRA